MTQQADGLDFTVRRMNTDDIGAAMALKDEAGWNQVPADWGRLLAWEPEGCFCAEVSGEVAGTATTTAYQRCFGWIGMVLIRADMRRRGIGRALMARCIEYLDGRGVAAIRLDATPMGRPMYEALGFVYEHGLERFEGTASAAGPSDARPATPELLDDLCTFDLPVFGADRSRVLRRLATDPDCRAWVTLGEQGVSGYVMLRPGSNAWYIGPMVCANPDAAESLVRAALSETVGQPIMMDAFLLGEHPLRLAVRHRLRRQREFARMYCGVNAYPGIPELVYAPAGPEIG